MINRWESLFVDGSEWEEDGEVPSALGSEYFIHLLKDVEGQGRRLVFKEPRFEGGGVLLEREGMILQLLAGEFSFSIPIPISSIRASDEKNKAGMAYAFLPGDPAIGVDEQGNPRWNVDGLSPVFIDSLAAALVQIHGMKMPEGCFPFDAGKVDLKSQFLTLLEKVDEGAISLLSESLRDWAEQTIWSDSACLIHGDMHAGNILVDDDGTVTGVIDWTHAEMGDPCQDFVFHYFGFGEAGLDQLLESYERQGGTVFLKMKEHIMGLWDAYPARKAWLDGLQGREGG